jgi:hypothetical protein
MTHNALAEKARFIPATGLRSQVGTVEISAFWVNAAGYTVQVRRDGLTIASQMHRHEHLAVDAFNTAVEQAEAETPAETATAPVVKLPAAAKGTTTKVSDPGHTTLAIAHLTGRIERGGKPGQAPIGVLNALAKRGHLHLTYQTGRSDARKVVTGGTITHAGRVALDKLTAEDRAAAELAAKLAVIDTIQLAA